MPDVKAQHLTKAENLVASAQFRHLVQGFEKACGLKLHVMIAGAAPSNSSFQPPAFCQALQAGEDCPLYFNPQYQSADGPELRPTCAGLGHAVIPVKSPDGQPLLMLVSDTVRFGPVDMEQITEKSFHLKVFPDTLAAEAESVQLVARERVLFAAQMVFAGLHELVGGFSARAGAVSMIIRKIADTDAERVPAAIAAAALEFCEAEYAYVSLVGPESELVAEAASAGASDPWFKILQGVGQWVIHADQTIDIADTRESAWCRHLAGGEPPTGAMVAMPLVHRDAVYGGVVVAGADVARLAEWSTALTVLTEAGGDALVLARRLVQVGDGSMVDRQTGAYNLHFIEELLEKEISRAIRHNHQLSVVLFHLANYAELLGQVGDQTAEQVLGQMVELMRSKTRKVNSLARVSDTDFCLVIPEAAQEVAEKIAADLTSVAQGTTYLTEVNGSSSPIRVALQTRTVANPTAVDTALESLVSSLN
ncbi:MAG TPA: diguanylate cyclase [Candidatus Solibacter sp.]|jgi:diguanylate cyclase (GGDEF)-like protein|nr:diguanylate cyclase [Candidatus Solibacter sp.]